MFNSNDRDDEARLAWSFKNVASSGCTLQMVLRYEAPLSRTHVPRIRPELLTLLRPNRPRREFYNFTIA